ncbi:hypothetical protein [Dongia sp.]|uniref:hypothetical protein n=1 Tax=Dongia sp. TaxID=1977262 RepID=UPI0035B02A78
MAAAIDFMSDPRISRASASAGLNATLSALPPAAKPSAILRFADFFIDGCDVRLFQGIDCHTQAALPDGSLIDLGGVFHGRKHLAEFGFESAS